MSRIGKIAVVLSVLALVPVAGWAGEVIHKETKLKSVTESDFVTEARQLTKEQVVAMQKALADKGFFKGETNGLWREDTDAAIKAYQSSNGVEANGVMRVADLKALGVDLGADDPTLNDVTPVSGGGYSYGKKTVYEYETRTVESVDIRTHGNGPGARGKQAFME